MGVCFALCFSRWSKEAIILSFGAQRCLFSRRSSIILQREKWLRKLKQFNQSCTATNRWQHAEKSTDERRRVFPSSRRWEKKRAGGKQEKRTLSGRQWKLPEITGKRLHEMVWRTTFKIITVVMRSCVCFLFLHDCGVNRDFLQPEDEDAVWAADAASQAAAAGCSSSLHRLRHWLSQLTAVHGHMLAQHFSLKSHFWFSKDC